MTVITKGLRTTAIAEDSIQRRDFGGRTISAEAAIQAHALLSQTMSDEQIDELVGAAVPFDQAIVIPFPFLFGSSQSAPPRRRGRLVGRPDGARPRRHCRPVRACTGGSDPATRNGPAHFSTLAATSSRPLA